MTASTLTPAQLARLQGPVIRLAFGGHHSRTLGPPLDPERAAAALAALYREGYPVVEAWAGPRGDRRLGHDEQAALCKRAAELLIHKPRRQT